MLELEPVVGWVVRADQASRVVAPPYDALTVAQREAAAASDPTSYLGALPTGTAGSAEGATRALRACRDHLDRLLAAGRFRELHRPSLLVLAITRDPSGQEPERTSVAVIGDLDVHAFCDRQVRPHEDTDPDRVAHLARYLEVVGVASSPVAVVQQPSDAVAEATTVVRDRPPELAFTDRERGEHVALWLVDDAATQRSLTTAVAAAGTGYVADGHHRAAAVARFARDHDLPAGHPAARVLSAVFSQDDLTVTPFHRVVDLTGHPQVLEALTSGDLSRLTDAGWTIRPGRADPPSDEDRWHVAVPGRWHLHHGDRWWVVEAGRTADPGTDRASAGEGPTEGEGDPVASLDAVRVEALLGDLGLPAGAARPVAPATLASSEPSRAPQVLGIALHPPSWSQVHAVADAGRTLPAKTTYLTPKLRSGLVVVPRAATPS